MNKTEPTPAPGSGLPLPVYLEAVERLSVAISITDTAANILYVNPAFEKLTGYARSEIVGQNESILSDKATPRPVYDDLWRDIRAGRTWSGKLVNRRKDGKRYLADLTVAPVLGDDGETAYYLGMHRDVSTRHGLERELRNQKALVETVVDSAPAVVMLLDVTGRVVIDNHAYKILMAELKGHEPAAEILAALEPVLGPDLKAACAAERGFTNFEVRFDMGGASEPRWFACSGTWVKELDQTAEGYFTEETSHGLLVVAHDITHQRRQFEQGKIGMVRALMAEQHMVQGMREVLSAALFKMQGPLNQLEAARGMLSHTKCLDGPAGPALDEVLRTGREAMEGLRAAMPERVAEAVEPVNLNEVIRDVLDISVDRFLKEGVVVEWKPKTVLRSVPAKANALRMLVKILLDNAIDAFREPGNTDREVRIVTRETEDGTVELVIEDSGAGIPEGLRRKVFEPFFTHWNASPGRAGMGLAVAQQVLMDQGGTITIDTSPLGGCRVTVDLAVEAPYSNQVRGFG